MTPSTSEKARSSISVTYRLLVIEDEFAEGKECCLLYEGVYQARQNLCERLEEEENADVEIIINGMEKIARLLAMKMFEYGKCGYPLGISR